MVGIEIRAAEMEALEKERRITGWLGMGTLERWAAIEHERTLSLPPLLLADVFIRMPLLPSHHACVSLLLVLFLKSLFVGVSSMCTCDSGSSTA